LATMLTTGCPCSCSMVAPGTIKLGPALRSQIGSLSSRSEPAAEAEEPMPSPSASSDAVVSSTASACLLLAPRCGAAGGAGNGMLALRRNADAAMEEMEAAFDDDSGGIAFGQAGRRAQRRASSGRRRAPGDGRSGCYADAREVLDDRTNRDGRWATRFWDDEAEAASRAGDENCIGQSRSQAWPPPWYRPHCPPPSSMVKWSSRQRQRQSLPSSASALPSACGPMCDKDVHLLVDAS